MQLTRGQEQSCTARESHVIFLSMWLGVQMLQLQHYNVEFTFSLIMTYVMFLGPGNTRYAPAQLLTMLRGGGSEHNSGSNRRGGECEGNC